MQLQVGHSALVEFQKQQQELMVILLGTATMIIFCYFPQDNVNEYPNIPGLYFVDDQYLRGLIW